METCPCCKNAPDTIKHRVWECQALAKEREECIPADVQLWAKQGGKDTLLANMCLGARGYSEEYPTEAVREKWRYVFGMGKL